MMLQLTMKALLNLIFSLFLAEYGTADMFKNRVDIALDGGEKKVDTKFKDTENTINKGWQDKSQSVKGIMLNDLLKILKENTGDEQGITSDLTEIQSDVHLDKRTYSSPGPSYGHGPGKHSCGSPPPHPHCGPEKNYHKEKCNGSCGQGYNQKKHYDSCDNNSCSNDCGCKKNKGSKNKKKKCKESCSCSDSSESCENNQGHNKKNNKKTKARREDGWDDADDGDDNYAQYW